MNESISLGGVSLWHHGVKGMHWGVRRTPEELGHKPRVIATDADSENSHLSEKLIIDNNGKAIKISGEFWKSDKGFVVHPNKIKRFCLLPEAKHSDHFFKVGYSKDDAFQLFHDLEDGYDAEKAFGKRKDGKGVVSYSIPMYLGTTSKRLFNTVWKNEGPDGMPKFVTAYIDDALEKELGLR